MNHKQTRKDFLYLADEVLPWLKYLEKRRARERIATKEKPIVKKPDKDKTGIEKFF